MGGCIFCAPKWTKDAVWVTFQNAVQTQSSNIYVLLLCWKGVFLHVKGPVSIVEIKPHLLQAQGVSLCLFQHCKTASNISSLEYLKHTVSGRRISACRGELRPTTILRQWVTIIIFLLALWNWREKDQSFWKCNFETHNAKSLCVITSGGWAAHYGLQGRS